MSDPGPSDPAMIEMMAEVLGSMAAPPDDPAAAAAREVGEAVRALIDRLTATSAPPQILLDIAGKVRSAVAQLGPYDAVRRYVGSAEASGFLHDRAFFDWSPQIGVANPLAPPLRVAVRDGMVVAAARFGLAYEGPPGCVHGGYIAAAFDEVLGLTQSMSGRVGMTGTLDVKYRRPTPLYRDLVIEGRLRSVNGRKVLTEGRLLDGGELCAEATGLFVSITPDKFRLLAPQREPGDA